MQLLAYGGQRGDKSSDARRLSLKRALIVRQLLIDNGVPSERIDVRAMGGVDDNGPAGSRGCVLEELAAGNAPVAMSTSFASRPHHTNSAIDSAAAKATRASAKRVIVAVCLGELGLQHRVGRGDEIAELIDGARKGAARFGR